MSTAEGAIRGRSVRREDYPAVVDLFADVFGRRISLEHYHWKLRQRDTPVDNVMMAVDRDDLPIFHIAGLPSSCRVAGIERLVMVAVDAMTKSTDRRRGLLTRYANELFGRWKDAGVALVLGMPNEAHGSRARALGWRPLSALDWLVLPIHPERILARKLGIPWLSRLELAGDIWRSTLALWRGSLHDIDVHEVASPDGDWGELSERLRIENDNGLIKDKDWMQWRYFNDPGRGYRVLKATNRATPNVIRGVVVCGVTDAQSLTIPEVLVARHDVAAFQALIRGVLTEFARDADSVRTLAVPGSWTHREFRRLGFSRRRHQFRVDCIQLDATIPWQELTTTSRWRFSGGDFDVV